MEAVVEDGRRPWTIVGADAREGRDRRQHHQPRRVGMGEVIAPDIGAGAKAGFEHHRRSTCTSALEMESAAAADVDETGKGPGCHAQRP